MLDVPIGHPDEVIFGFYGSEQPHEYVDSNDMKRTDYRE